MWFITKSQIRLPDARNRACSHHRRGGCAMVRSAKRSRRAGRFALALAAVLTAAPSHANEGVESFYSRNPVTLIVSTAAGGGVDAYSRLLARHLGRHIPG